MQRTREELHALLSAADVVFLLCPLNESTQGMIGAAELALMQPGALLVNTARAGLVESELVLYDALTSGALGGVALDVHWQEPTFGVDAGSTLHPLYELPNVLATPHAAPNTHETWDAIASHCVNCIQLVREGRSDVLPARVDSSA